MSSSELESMAQEAPAGELILEECLELARFLIEKNQDYGNSVLEPERVFSNADPEEQIKVRLDDKLSRLKSGPKNFDDEDTTLDLLGYLVFLRISRRDDDGGK